VFNKEEKEKIAWYLNASKIKGCYLEFELNKRASVILDDIVRYDIYHNYDGHQYTIDDIETMTSFSVAVLLIKSGSIVSVPTGEIIQVQQQEHGQSVFDANGNPVMVDIPVAYLAPDWINIAYAYRLAVVEEFGIFQLSPADWKRMQENGADDGVVQIGEGGQ
jgi:hypothetical protein